MGTFSSVSLYGWGLMSPAYIVSLLLRDVFMPDGCL